MMNYEKVGAFPTIHIVPTSIKANTTVWTSVSSKQKTLHYCYIRCSTN